MTEKQIAKELERQKVLFEEKCSSGQFLDGSIKLSDFSEQWFTDYAEKQLKSKTVAHYRELMKRILPALGHLRMDRIQPHHLIEFYNNLAESGIRIDTKYQSKINFASFLKERKLTKAALSKEAHVSVATLDSLMKGNHVALSTASKLATTFGKPLPELFTPFNQNQILSAKTINSHHRLLSSVFSTAVQWQIILSNPCDRVKPPKLERKESRYLDEVQTAELISCLDQEPDQYRAIILLFIYTGMRRGELCGLKWEDFDAEKQLLHIRRELLYLPEKGIYEDTTKTYGSERVIKLSEDAVYLLAQHRLAQNIERMKLGDRWQNRNYIFTTYEGGAIHPDTITSWFHKFVTRRGLPPVSVHSLRHIYTTNFDSFLYRTS